MGRYDEARSENEASMMKEPNNPVCPMAPAVTRYNAMPAITRVWYQKAV